MKRTQENSGSKCSKTEFLNIEIYNHFSKPHSYIVWNNKQILGEAVEDAIMNILNKNQLVDFYHFGKNKFKVERKKIENNLLTNDK